MAEMSLRELTRMPEELKVSVGTLVNEFTALPAVLDNDIDYAGGVEHMKKIKARLKIANDRKKAITDPINASLKSVRELFDELTRGLVGQETTLQTRLNNYLRLKDQRGAELRRKREQEAEEERQRQLRAAEEEQKHLEEQAAKAEEKGDTQRAEVFLGHAQAAEEVAQEIATAPAQVPEVIARTTVYTEHGATGFAARRRVVKAVTDLAKVPREYIQDDLKDCLKMKVVLKRLSEVPEDAPGGEHIPGIEDEMEVTAKVR